MLRHFLAILFLTTATFAAIAGEPSPVRMNDTSVALAAPDVVFPTIAADQSRPSAPSASFIDDPGPGGGNDSSDICETGTATSDQRCSFDGGTLYTCVTAYGRICKVVYTGTKYEKCKTCFN
jgi:hypothetical protein